MDRERDKPLSLIIGHQGQDGRLLRQALDESDAPWVGIGVGVAEASKAAVPPVTDICDPSAVEQLIAATKPDRIYFLAAYHGSSESAERADLQQLHRASWMIHVGAWLNCLDAVCRHGLATRLLYASSSLVIGDRTDGQSLQDETTAWKPIGVYGLTKALGAQAAIQYRQQRGVHACVAHLYNHESIYRSPQFLSRKVTDAAARIAAGSHEKLTLGSLDAVTDWGYAPDTVRAMRLVLDHDRPDDYVIATGIGHTVRRFVQIAFDEVGLDWADHVRIDQAILSRGNAGRVGNPRKLRQVTGWKPRVDFETMVRLLTRASVERLGRD